MQYQCGIVFAIKATMMIRRLPTLSSHNAVGGRGRMLLNLFFTEDTIPPIKIKCTNIQSCNYSTTTSIHKKMNSSTYSYRKKKHHKKIEDDLLLLNTNTKKYKIQALKQQIDMLSNEVHQPITHTTKKKKVKSVYKKPTTSMPMNKKGPYSIFISCLPGLEPLLLSEVQYLLQSDTISEQKQSNKQTKKVPGGVTVIIPSLSYIHLLHLYLGTASHIYLRLNDNNSRAQLANIPSTFTALGFPELKRKIKDLIVAQCWDDLLLIPKKKKKNGSSTVQEVVEASELPWKLSIHVTTSKSKLIHTKAVEERVRDVIGNVLGINGLNDKEKSDTKDDNRPTIRLLVRIERDEVQLSLDTSTTSSTNTSVSPMHMRGYRLDPYKAPLREDLAFALLLVGGVRPAWNLDPLNTLLGKKSSSIDMATEEKKKEQTGIQLFDPLCGSGTIAIEGASILAGLPPGRFRSAPLQGTSLYDEKLWNDMRSKALSVASGIGKDGDNSELVAANDINSHAIKAAQSNAQRAGVDHLISFHVGSFKTHPLLNPSRKSSTVKTLSTSNPLKIVTNPPYGKRISNTTQSKSSIYKQIAKSIKHSNLNNVECTLIGKDIRSLRESSLPLEVGFSTRHGGVGVIAMTSSSSSAESKDG